MTPVEIIKFNISFQNSLKCLLIRLSVKRRIPTNERKVDNTKGPTDQRKVVGDNVMRCSAPGSFAKAVNEHYIINNSPVYFGTIRFIFQNLGRDMLCTSALRFQPMCFGESSFGKPKICHFNGGIICWALFFGGNRKHS